MSVKQNKLKEEELFMIVFKEDKYLFEQYRKRIKEFLKEYPENADFVKVPNEFSDVICPYVQWIQSLTDEDKRELHVVPDDDISFDGIYIVCSPNDHYLIEQLTNYKEIDSLHDYGVVDNASQILQNADIPENAVIFMCPEFKQGQGDFGWRWHKWGPYYGIQEHEHEYLADEKNTEMVYTFSVIALKQKD